jgi:hypothetical protein
MKIPMIAGMATFLLIAAAACKKDNNSSGSFTVKLTDAPFNAQEVNVDIRQVQVNYANDSTGWISLNTNAGVYNLLALQNNVQATLATGNNTGGTVQELRFILGSANSIKIDSVSYPLTIPSGGESGLKIKVGKKFAATADSLVVDFDAGLSIIKTGNNEYKLKPVLKLK